MNDSPEDDSLRRYFLAVATREYEASGTYRPLPGVVDEVRVLSDWLCSPQLGDHGYTHIEPELADDPTKQQIASVWEDTARVWSGSAMVMFVTGHGIVHNGAHRLVVKATDPGKLSTTTVPTAEVVEWVSETAPGHLMMILDLCYSGVTAEQVAKFDTPFPPNWLVLASTTKHAAATTGALTSAIAEFLADLRSDSGERFNHGPYLKVSDFLQEVQAKLAARGQRLALVQGGGLPNLATMSPCLPNPRHRPDDTPHVAPQRRDLAIRPADLDAHWGPRSRGVATADDPGWLFTGRVTLMHQLIDAAIGEPTATVVTGGAGCGKSAALARLVTLSDRLFLDIYSQQVKAVPADLIPPAGAVDVAIVATGKLPHEVFGQLCDALIVAVPKTGSSPTLAELRSAWWTWLRTRAEPVTIVVDALDEATYPTSLLDDVLAQLEPPDTTARLVRLIVGVRSTTGDHTTGTRELADLTEAHLSARRLRVDQPPSWNPDDVTSYATAILATTPVYAAAEAEYVHAVAATIGAKAATSFLFTRLAATSLTHRSEKIDPADPDWLASLNDGVVGVFRNDLHTTIINPEHRLRAIHLLRAVAFAYGQGLPWYQIWPRVANAVANDPDRHYGDGDIAWLLNTRLAGYLITDTEDDTTVYRLFHDALRNALRNDWRTLLDGQS